MLNVTKNRTDEFLEVRLAGSIDESTHFDQLIGPPPRDLRVYCKDVTHINSMGVVHWIRYFVKLQEQGCLIRLYECSTVIVDQMNFIQNFSCGARIESVCVPLACQSCKSELIAVFRLDDLKKMEPGNLRVKCTRCSGEVFFDDDPREYFAFISRIKS